MEPPIAEECEKKRKSQSNSKNKEPSPPSATVPETSESPSSSGIPVSLFDYSVENHFKAVDTISKLTGIDEITVDEADIQRLASSITFLTEWQYLKYETRKVKFTCENKNSKGNDVIGQISLPQFSSAQVPKDQQLVNDEKTVPEKSSNDFVMYVGGLVWGMDWCPQAHENRDAPIKSEFVTVAAYPPDSSYHRIGVPITGRGVIQIWCLLDLIQKDVKEDLLTQVNEKTKRNSTKIEAFKGVIPGPQKPRGRPRKNLDEAVKGKTSGPPKPRGRPRKNLGEAVKGETSGPPKPRGRPRKKPVTEPLGDRDSDGHNLPLAMEYPHHSNELSVDLSCENISKAQEDFEQNQERSVVVVSLDAQTTASKRRGVKNKTRAKGQTENSGLTPPTQVVAEESPVVRSQTYARNGLVSAGSSEGGASAKRRKTEKERKENQTHDSTLALLTQDVAKESPNMLSQTPESHCIISSQFDENGSHVKQHIPTDVPLPRMVLSLAHNGKLARDVKWRPLNHGDVSRHSMGYLALVLGNGALEVWEVPFPHTIKVIYPSLQKKGTDPRFLKLQPVFRCSMLKCGDWQSIPLTVEWSASPSHDLILAGCHDGLVALWKFSANNSSKDTRPLLCFSADTVPIRALSWAPSESDTESANIIITAGHKGLKVWDLRDPFRPLREYNPGQGVYICSLDWLPEPRGIVISCDDGTLKILSLPKAAYDVPVTGDLSVGTKQQGFHSFTRSLLAIWCVQASRLTGMVAYCGADGTAARFQMTKRMESDAVRNRSPHLLCGSFSKDESGISVITPVPDSPFRMTYSGKQWRDAILKSPHGVNSVPNWEKRAIKESDEQRLALCYGNDPNVEEGSDDELVAQTSNTKTKTTSKKLEADAFTSTCYEEDKFEELPPKIVSTNRVRWNMNKGSERWLCYGGAAGLVRCQKIDL